MTTRADRMFAEVDRQLEMAKAQAEGIATRSGYLLTAVGIGAALLSSHYEAVKNNAVVALYALGIAILLGIATQIPALTRGPTPVQLTLLSTNSPAGQAMTDLFTAKILALEVNARRVVILTVIFYGQVVAAVASIAIALAYTNT